VASQIGPSFATAHLICAAVGCPAEWPMACNEQLLRVGFLWVLRGYQFVTLEKEGKWLVVD
jgi:hypothetical protein